MTWKDLVKPLASLGLPIIGAAIGGPAGAAIGKGLAAALGLGADASPEQIAAALGNVSGEQIVALKALDAQMAKDKFEHDTAARQADSADLASVNATMQHEADASANENWWQKGWRPYNGYVVGTASMLAVTFVCYLFYVALTTKGLDGLAMASIINVIPQLAMSIAALLAVPGAAVGITAWHRGVVQRIQAQNGSDNDGK